MTTDRDSKRELLWTADATSLAADSSRTVRSLTEEDISVVFQPIVSMRDGSVFALESLVRCTVQGFENPTDLFAHAVREKACGRLGRLIRQVAFRRGAGQRLFFNIHPMELSSRWMVQPDDPMYFHDNATFMEITESAAFDHFELSLSVLKAVRERAPMNLVIDDLGAGYSNLKRVLDLEPSVVKLDMSLVRHIDENPRQFRLIRSMVGMFSDIGATVVAEGIETLAEFRCLCDAGVTYGQGYLLARPAWPIPPVVWPGR